MHPCEPVVVNPTHILVQPTVCIVHTGWRALL